MLLVDKPSGVTSHDVVGGIRRSLPKGTRVGHAGTLDPFATGLLIVLVGRATRTQKYFMGLDKEYLAKARFGAVSTTLDRDGEVSETGVVPVGELSLPTGKIEQIPPKFSALHVNGKRAHQLAREGVEFDLPPRIIHVHAFEQLWATGSERGFRIRCGSGTYVRSLVADLGDAYCEELRRTAIGPFRLAEDYADSPPQGLELIDALAEVMPAVSVDDEDAFAMANGRPIKISGLSDGPHAVIGPEGLVAIAELRNDGLLASSVGFVG